MVRLGSIVPPRVLITVATGTAVPATAIEFKSLYNIIRRLVPIKMASVLERIRASQ
jgi:hypothetical protein